MRHICTDCGFTKECSDDEFMKHMIFHEYFDEVLLELGMLPPEPVVILTVFTGENDE